MPFICFHFFFLFISPYIYGKHLYNFGELLGKVCTCRFFIACNDGDSVIVVDCIFTHRGLLFIHNEMHFNAKSQTKHRHK